MLQNIPQDHSSELLNMIHECVVHSTIRHILNINLEIILEYLSKYPFYRGADTLYYFILKKYGKSAYYSSQGNHLITIQPELSGIYILAEQDMNALAIKDISGATIYPILEKSINRTITCERYNFRHSIITEEASINDAIKIPSISLNISKYQEYYRQTINNSNTIKLLIEMDCWEPIPSLNYAILTLMIERVAYMAAIAPNFWKHHLRKYYIERFLILNIHNILPNMNTKQLTALNTLFPDLIKLPLKLNTLGIRLWYTDKLIRAYLLGCDIIEGIPSDNIISEKLQKLQNVGIETYVDCITGVYIDSNNCLTGKIGEYFFPNFQGKKLLNIRTSLNTLIGSHYISDLIPIIYEDNVEFILVFDVLKIFSPEDIINSEAIINAISLGKIGTRKILISIEEAEKILDRVKINTHTLRCVPAKIRLVEVMSNDIINY